MSELFLGFCWLLLISIDPTGSIWSHWLPLIPLISTKVMTTDGHPPMTGLQKWRASAESSTTKTLCLGKASWLKCTKMHGRSGAHICPRNLCTSWVLKEFSSLESLLLMSLQICRMWWVQCHPRPNMVNNYDWWKKVIKQLQQKEGWWSKLFQCVLICFHVF